MMLVFFIGSYEFRFHISFNRAKPTLIIIIAFIQGRVARKSEKKTKSNENE